MASIASSNNNNNDNLVKGKSTSNERWRRDNTDVLERNYHKWIPNSLFDSHPEFLKKVITLDQRKLREKRNRKSESKGRWERWRRSGRGWGGGGEREQVEKSWRGEEVHCTILWKFLNWRPLLQRMSN